MCKMKNIACFFVVILLSGCAGQQLQLGNNAFQRGQYDVAANHWNGLAKNGNPYAQYNLGLLWKQGLGSTPKNEAEASQWFLLSAKQGYVPAMVRLARLQKNGGYEEAATSWLNLAARLGNSEAVSELQNWGKPVPQADLLANKQYQDAVSSQAAINALGGAAYQLGRAIGGGGASSYSSYSNPSQTGTYLGNYSANPYNSNSISNPYGAGSQYNANSINNQYGTYGSSYSSKSATNPYATDAPKLYDSQGNYRGKLSNNPYDPDSISNPYGRYGSPYSPDSVNNPYGAGNPYSPDSPNNPYGTGLKVIGE